MGSQVIFWFMKWYIFRKGYVKLMLRVEADGYGNGGPTWCNDNISAFVNVIPICNKSVG
jgi:hypothetical protein